MNITAETKLELERRARQTKDKSEHTRLCVILARSEGVSPELIAQTHRISVSSVYQYVADFEKENKTKPEIRRGALSKLTYVQAQELIEHLDGITYHHVKDICQYVKSTYGVIYSRPAMNKWLLSQGFVYKEPIKVPGKLEIAKQQLFIDIYKQLKANLQVDEKIYFLDAVHPAFQSQAVCGWILKRQVKTLPTTNKQYRLHFIGALDIQAMNLVASEYKTVNAQNMISYLKVLEAQEPASLIHIICDNGRANKNKALKEYLKTSKIKMHYLPAYSPNLNPIERLWKIMRECKTYNKCYDSFDSFANAIRSFFKEIPKLTHILKKRINDNFQLIQINHIQSANS